MHVIVIQSCLTCNNVTMSSGHMGLFQTFLDFTVLLRPHQGVTGHRLTGLAIEKKMDGLIWQNNQIIQLSKLRHFHISHNFCSFVLQRADEFPWGQGSSRSSVAVLRSSVNYRKGFWFWLWLRFFLVLLWCRTFDFFYETKFHKKPFVRYIANSKLR